MNREFIQKFMQAYSDYLFPNEEKTAGEISETMMNSKTTNTELLINFPFASPRIAKILAFFGLEIFYVWDKYVFKMYAYKVLVCLLPAVPQIFSPKYSLISISLSVFLGILASLALIIMQKKIRKRMPSVCRKYNCDILVKALKNPQSIELRTKYIRIMQIIFFVLKDKETRRAVKELRDSFCSY